MTDPTLAGPSWHGDHYDSPCALCGGCEHVFAGDSDAYYCGCVCGEHEQEPEW